MLAFVGASLKRWKGFNMITPWQCNINMKKIFVGNIIEMKAWTASYIAKLFESSIRDVRLALMSENSAPSSRPKVPRGSPPKATPPHWSTTDSVCVSFCLACYICLSGLNFDLNHWLTDKPGPQSQANILSHEFY
jgi:hypothetical protein